MRRLLKKPLLLIYVYEVRRRQESNCLNLIRVRSACGCYPLCEVSADVIRCAKCLRMSSAVQNKRFLRDVLNYVKNHVENCEKFSNL